mmetsp:Transcript_20198/g.55957  ORF Transcript_20198/g.55957 Transcript_20198/m.55957 type:complete len:442 (+) Transcript_20198:88-1413(+)
MVSSVESVLIYECAGLYTSFALESLSSFMLGLTFLYMFLLISCKSELDAPGRAAFRLVRSQFMAFFNDTMGTMRHWDRMPELPLEQRFAFCRKLNRSICLFSAMVSFLALTRWLHIENVNGFRYLGFALTCPLMQAELVVLIAPLVPFYKFNVLFVLVVTCTTMLSGYLGSTFPGLPYEGDIIGFIETWDLDVLQPNLKFWVVLPSFLCMAFLVVIQIPSLAILWYCGGGRRPCKNLPYTFHRLLLLVAVTWTAFPVWWWLSSEGFSVIKDTKLNGFGFCFLNISSKASFTLTMMGMVKRHKRMWNVHIPGPAPSPAAGQESWYVALLRPYDHEMPSERSNPDDEVDVLPGDSRGTGRHATTSSVQFVSNLETLDEERPEVVGKLNSSYDQETVVASAMHALRAHGDPAPTQDDTTAVQATKAQIIEGEVVPRVCPYMCAA